MASSRHRIKRLRQSEEKRQANLPKKRTIKSRSKIVVALAKEKKKEEAQSLLREVHAKIDKALKQGVLHKKTAARKKSRITKALNSALSS